MGAGFVCGVLGTRSRIVGVGDPLFSKRCLSDRDWYLSSPGEALFFPPQIAKCGGPGYSVKLEGAKKRHPPSRHQNHVLKVLNPRSSANHSSAEKVVISGE